MDLDLRLRAAIAAGHTAAVASRRLGRGSGRSVGGRALVAVDPRALRKLARGRRVVLVSGTNGKTTTATLTAAALGHPAATNGGSNLPHGAAWALTEHDEPSVVLEVDELYLPQVLRETNPLAVVALNLSRDQLDRTHEVHRIAELWGEAFAACEAMLIANAADPLVAEAAARASQRTWIDSPTAWTRDAVLCPRCARLLSRRADRWWCACGFAQPEADVSVGPGWVRLLGTTVPLDLALPGEVNVGNAAFAIAAAAHLGVAPAQAAGRLTAIRSVDGRYAEVALGGRSARLLLAKNPAGWQAALTMLNPSAQWAFGINAREADGRDPSWLWDVPFERLAGRRVAAFGDRAADLAVRLHYAGVEASVHRSAEEAAAALPAGPVELVANYTAFQRVVREHAADGAANVYPSGTDTQPSADRGRTGDHAA